MNRREFLKGGLAGAFGAFLTWAGVVRGEEVAKGGEGDWGYARNFQHDPESDLGHFFSQNGQIDWPRTRAVLEEIGILPDNMYWDCRSDEECLGKSWKSPGICATCSNNVSRNYSPETGGVLPGPATSDQALNALIESANRWNEQVSDNVSWDYSLKTGGARRAAPVYGGCDKCACRAECEDGDISYCSARPIDRWGEPLCGAAIGFSAQYPEGRWVYWDASGSDENGTGTTKDPVRTPACAQSIADDRSYIEVANYDWPEYADEPVGYAGSGAMLFVDGSAGDDSNDGFTVETALRTYNEAIRRGGNSIISFSSADHLGKVAI